MLFNQVKYKVFKCGPDTETQYKVETSYEDEYGSTRFDTKEMWKPFHSELHYIEHPYNQAATMYSNFVNHYDPIAPSGKYNQRFADLYSRVLRNMEFVGYYDGKECDFDVPNLYTSAQELCVLDVFDMELDHTYRDGIWKSSNTITIPAHTPLVLEKYDGMIGQHFETFQVSELETGKKYELCGDIRVNKLGHIKLVREYVKE